jgi:hypothetical protein
MSDKKMVIADMEPLVSTVGKRVEPWQGRFMSSTTRLASTNYFLLSLPLFFMGLLLLTDGTHSGFNKHMGWFFWEGSNDKHKYQWVNWPEVCLPRDQGGHGIMNTKLMNIALMVKWIWRLFTEQSD